MSVKTTAVYAGNLMCDLIHENSGSVIKTEAPLDNGGKGTLFSPTDLVGAALSSCILTIMGKVAERENLDLKGTKIEVTKEMVQVPVRKISKINLLVTFPPDLELTSAQRTKLRSAANTCPVKARLHPDVEVNIQYA